MDTEPGRSALMRRAVPRIVRLPRLATEEHTPAEELANALTHGAGAVLALAGFLLLIAITILEEEPWLLVGLVPYGTTLLLVYAASTLHHAVRHPVWKDIWKRCDQAAIFLFIAGSYTPFGLYVLGGGWGWALVTLVWALAVAGVAFKAHFHNRKEWLTISFYLGLGWLGLLLVGPISTELPAQGVALLVGGGLAYTAGVGFYVWHALPFNHAVWHLFVLCGSAMHFAAVLFYVVPAA